MSSTSAILHILPTTPVGSEGDALRLSAGQLLRGLVVRATPGTVELLVRGQIVPVRTELGLTPGAQITLQVREVGSGGITLVLAPPESAAQGRPTEPAAQSRPLLPDDLHDVAEALRLPAGGRSVAVLRELMANGRPLTANAVQAVLTAARSVAPDGNGPLRPLVWLMSQGLPVTPATMALVAAALPEGEPLPAPTSPGGLPAVRLATQARALDDLLARAIPSLPPPAHALALGLRAALARLGLAGPPPDPLTPEGLAVRLIGIAEGVGTPLAAKLARTLIPGRPAAPTPAMLHPAGPTALMLRQAAGMTFPPASVAEGPGSGTARTGPALDRLPDLRLLIERTVEVIVAHRTTSAGDGRGQARTAAVVEALTTLATGLEFSQLANAARPEVSDGRQTYWLPLPLPPAADGQPPSLAVSRWEGGDDDGQPRRLRAALTLSLPHLGDLSLCLDLTGRHLRCDLRAAADRADLIGAALGDLDARLAGLGYTVETTAGPTDPIGSPALTAPAPRRIDQHA